MNDDLKDEIETLQSVYNDDELTIDYDSDKSIHIIYIAKLEDSTEINVDFSINGNNNYSISILNGVNTQKIIPSDIVSKIENILIEKYKEEIESMPIFQCISYCNDELLEDEQINLLEELKKIKKIKPKVDEEELFWSEVEKYRKEFKQNGGSMIPYVVGKIDCVHILSDEKVDLKDNYISDDVKKLLSHNKHLWRSIPSINTVRTWLDEKYATKDFQVNFISTCKNIKKFLNNGGKKSKSSKFSVVFHGTSSYNDESIIENGLVVGGTKGVAISNGAAYGNGVYCSPSLDTAKGYARGSLFVCLVREYECQRHGNVYVVPNDNDILPIYLTNGTFNSGYQYNIMPNNAFFNKMKWLVTKQKKYKSRR